MDLTEYAARKAAGSVTVAKLRDAYVLYVSRFNPYTGEPENPDVRAIDKTEVERQISDLQEKINNLQALLDDLQALG